MSSSSNYVNLTVRANQDGSRSYYQHDDRERRGFSNHRGRSRKWGKGRRGPMTGGDGSHGVDNDGDVNMASEDQFDQRKRYTPYGPPRGKTHLPSRGGGRRPMGDKDFRGGGNHQYSAGPNGNTIWSRIIIPHGRKFSRSFLLQTLTQACQVPFIPFNYQYDGNSAVFYVDSKAAANAIFKLNRQLTAPDGPKIAIIVRSCPPPSIPLSDEIVEAIKACVSRRFNPATNAVDLCDFTADPVLRGAGLFLQLVRPHVLGAVLRALSDIAPNLVELNLSENGLNSLELLGGPLRKLPGLRRLNLRQNQISRPSEIDKIKDIPLEELSLSGNPLCNIYKDHSDYVEVVRKRFPKLTKLDGSVLPMQISFEVEKVVSMPASQGSFFVNEDARRVVITFLEQYYALYDSDDRQGLVEAYHEEAMFSMSSFRPPQRSAPLGDYVHCSRNLLKVPDSDRRFKLLNLGKMNIIYALKRLPRTRHDPSSFSVDVGLVSPTILSFAICGVFKEIENKINDYPIRAFSRAFVLIPQGSGFSIVNEMLLVTSPTADQIKTAFKAPAPTPSPSPVLMPNTDEAVRQQMVTSFAQQSGMNLEWSVKCLEDNGWDYNKAAHIFTELNAQGRIPIEAFQN